MKKLNLGWKTPWEIIFVLGSVFLILEHF
jgi:hypothetical protein